MGFRNKKRVVKRKENRKLLLFKKGNVMIAIMKLLLRKGNRIDWKSKQKVRTETANRKGNSKQRKECG